jgi:hypothetical protein
MLRENNRLLGWMAALAIVHGLLYAFLIPPWQAPDEIAHFEYARLFAEHWRPVELADASPTLEHEIIDSLYRYRAWYWIGWPTPEERPGRLEAAPFFGRSRTLGRFSLAYVLYAVAVWPFREQDVITQLYVMRCVSVLLGAVVVVLAFRIAQRVEPDAPELRLGAALFLIFLPQHAFITAVVSDGNLAECLASAVIYLLIKMWREGVRWSQVVIALTATFMAWQTKTTTYFLVPLLIVLAFSFLQRRAGAHRRVWSLSGIGVIGTLAVLAALAAWGLQSEIAKRSAYHLKDLARIDYILALLDTQAAYSLSRAVWGAFKSYWLTLGWMSLSLPEPVYYLLAGLTAAAVAGLLTRFRVQPPPSNLSSYRILSLSASLPIAFLLTSFFFASLYVFQGRYVFGGIVAQAIVLVAGWLSLVPRHHRGWAFWAITTGLLMFDTVSFGLIIPFYYT